MSLLKDHIYEHIDSYLFKKNFVDDCYDNFNNSVHKILSCCELIRKHRRSLNEYYELKTYINNKIISFSLDLKNNKKIKFINDLLRISNDEEYDDFHKFEDVYLLK